jgi:hypothetical protein
VESPDEQGPVRSIQRWLVTIDAFVRRIDRDAHDGDRPPEIDDPRLESCQVLHQQPLQEIRHVLCSFASTAASQAAPA